MANIVTCTTKDGETIQYVDEIIGSGSMKDVYFSPDKSYVVAFYKKPQNDQAKERIDMITGRYGRIFSSSPVGSTGKIYFAGPPMSLSIMEKLGLWCPPTKIIFSLSTVLKTMIFLA